VRSRASSDLAANHTSEAQGDETVQQLQNLQTTRGTFVNSIVIGYLFGVVPYGLILLKGKVKLFLGALLVGLIPFAGVAFPIAASFRLARPNSWWARHRYGLEKIEASRARFPDAPLKPATGTAMAGAMLLVLVPVAVVVAGLLSLS
jgi:hypothetical protein